MNTAPVEVIVAAFPTPDGGAKVMEDLRAARREGLIGIEDMAIVVKDANGKLKITNAKHRGARGFLTGGLVGGLIGVLAGPAGLAIGGGALGALAGMLRDHPMRVALTDLGDSLVSNSSAIVAVIEHTWVAEYQRALAAKGAKIVHDAFKADVAEQLSAGGNVLYTGVVTESGAAGARIAESKGETKASGVVAGADKVSAGRISATDQGAFVEHATLTSEKLAGGAAVATGSGVVRGEVRTTDKK